MSERREHKSWCPAYPGNVYVKTDGERHGPEGSPAAIVKGKGRPCQCGAELSLRARRIIYGESAGR